MASYALALAVHEAAPEADFGEGELVNECSFRVRSGKMMLLGCTEGSPQERARFEQGQGGALTPRMCVDRSLVDLSDWTRLAAEADQQSRDWRMVMVGALAGAGGRAPQDDAIEQALNRMVMAIHQGQIQGFIPFDRQGQAVHFG